MAITAANVDSGQQDTAINNGGTQATASIAFANNKLYVLTMGSRGTAPMDITSVTGGGITWAKTTTSFTGTGPNLSQYWGLVTSGASTGALTMTLTGGPTSSFKWVVDEFTGVNTTTPIVQTAAVVNGLNQAIGTVALSAFADATNNVAYGVFNHNIQEAFTVDASGGWAKLADNQSVVSGVLVTMSEWKTGQDTSVTATWSTATDRWSGVALEIAAGATTTTVLPPLIASNVALFASRIIGKPAPGFIASNVALFAPKAIGVPRPGLIGPTSTLFAPTNVATVRIYEAFIGPTGVLFAGREILTVKPPPASVVTFNDAVVIFDAPGVPFDASTRTRIFAPGAAAVSATKLPPLIASNVTAFAPKVAIAERPGFIGPTNQLFAPTALVARTVLPGFIGSNLTLFSPSIPGGVVAPSIAPLGSTAIHITQAPPAGPGPRTLRGSFINMTAFAWAPRVKKGSKAQTKRQAREDEELLLLLP